MISRIPPKPSKQYFNREAAFASQKPVQTLLSEKKGVLQRQSPHRVFFTCASGAKKFVWEFRCFPDANFLLSSPLVLSSQPGRSLTPVINLIIFPLTIACPSPTSQVLHLHCLVPSCRPAIGALLSSHLMHLPSPLRLPCNPCLPLLQLPVPQSCPVCI